MRMGEEPSISSPFLEKLDIAKNHILESQTVRIISHYDADGITSTGILATTLLRMRKGFHASIVKDLDAHMFSILAEEENTLVIFSDMGSGQLDEIEKLKGPSIILDHHHPLRESKDVNKTVQINAHHFGINGTYEASGATMCYLLAVHLDPSNKDLVGLCIAGNVGDRQHTGGGLKGINREILNDAITSGSIKLRHDLALSGADISDALFYTTDPYFTGISGSKEGVASFLSKVCIQPSKRLSELTPKESRMLSSMLALKLLSQGALADVVEDMVSERYYSSRERMSVEDLEALVNACGRTGNEGLGLGLLLGDSASLAKARELQRHLKEALLKGVRDIEVKGAKTLSNLHYVIVEDPSLAGSVAYYALAHFLDPEKPIIALSYVGDSVKISARGSKHLVSKGLHFAKVCSEATKLVGGHGGGHDVAAGGSVPKGKEMEFIEHANKMIGEQFAAKKGA